MAKVQIAILKQRSEDNKYLGFMLGVVITAIIAW